MKICIRSPQYRELEIEGRRRVEDLLKELRLNRETHIVARNGEMVTEDEWIETGDEVEIIAAISGGAP